MNKCLEKGTDCALISILHRLLPPKLWKEIIYHPPTRQLTSLCAYSPANKMRARLLARGKVRRRMDRGRKSPDKKVTKAKQKLRTMHFNVDHISDGPSPLAFRSFKMGRGAGRIASSVRTKTRYREWDVHEGRG